MFEPAATRTVHALLLTPAINCGRLCDISVTETCSYWEDQFDPGILAAVLSGSPSAPVPPEQIWIDLLATPRKTVPDKPASRTSARDLPTGTGIALAWTDPLRWAVPSFDPANRVASQLANWFSFESSPSRKLPIRGNAVFIAVDNGYTATGLPNELSELAAEVAGYDQNGWLTRYRDFTLGKRPRRGDKVWWEGKLRTVLQIQRSGAYLKLQLDFDLTDWATRPRSGWRILPKDIT
jgi:hypothetical protein